MPTRTLSLLALLLLANTCCRASETSATEELLPLPNTASPSRTLNLGEKLALDELGPLIVNSDGSLRRIANWPQLSPAEQAVALKRLSKRNKDRLVTLGQAQAAVGQEQEQQADDQQQQREKEVQQSRQEL